MPEDGAEPRSGAGGPRPGGATGLVDRAGEEEGLGQGSGGRDRGGGTGRGRIESRDGGGAAGTARRRGRGAAGKTAWRGTGYHEFRVALADGRVPFPACGES